MELWSSHLPISGSGKNDLMRRPHLRRRFSFRFHPMWNDFHMFLTAKHPYVSLQPYSPVLHVYFITVLQQQTRTSDTSVFKVPLSLQYFKTYLQNHNLLHASVKAETSGNCESSHKCFDCFAGSDIRYLTRGIYPSSDSLAGHIRCGTIGTKASCPDMSKYLSRHENKTYPLMLTERSEATEATAARQGHKTSQNITNWQTKLNRVQRMELWSSHLPISGSRKNDLMRRPHLRRRFSFRFHPMWNDFHMFLTAKHPYVSLQPYSPVLHVYFITVLQQQTRTSDTSVFKVPMSLQYFKTYLQNHNLLHASVKAETSGNCESCDKCFDCFAGSDIRYLTRGTYPSSDSLAGHIRCGTIGTKTSCPVRTRVRPKKISTHADRTLRDNIT